MSSEPEEGDAVLALTGGVEADPQVEKELEQEGQRLNDLQSSHLRDDTPTMERRGNCTNCGQRTRVANQCPHCSQEWCTDCTTLDGRGVSRENCLQVFERPVVGKGYSGQRILICWDCVEMLHRTVDANNSGASAGTEKRVRPPAPPPVTECQRETWRRCDEESAATVAARIGVVVASGACVKAECRESVSTGSCRVVDTHEWLDVPAAGSH